MFRPAAAPVVRPASAGVAGAQASKKQRTRARNDSVTRAGVSVDSTTDMNFWRDQSANEIRSQLNLRNRRGIRNWAFEARPQLLELIEHMIKKGSWIQKQFATPARDVAYFCCFIDIHGYSG